MFKSLYNVTSLNYVDMSGLGIRKLGLYHYSVFENLLNVETIILNDNPDLAVSYGFTGNFWAHRVPNLKHLHLVKLGIHKHIIDLLVQKLSSSEKATSKLKSLILDYNRISGINTGIYAGLKSLEVISISYNQMSSPIDLILELFELPNLRYLNLSRQNQITALRSRRSVYITNLSCRSPHTACAVRFPRNLTHLDLSYSGFQLPAIPPLSLMNNNSLQFVYLSSNSIRMMPEPFYCPSYGKIKPVFEFVDLSNNIVECINSSYFNHCDWSSLNVFNLSGNRMRQVFEKTCNHNMTYFLAFLQPLWNLTKLDLSGNVINNNLLLDSFQKQNLLEELYISKILKVNLNSNPLQCNCQGFLFLKWLKATKISFERNNLTCMLDEVRYSMCTQGGAPKRFFHLL